MTRSLSRAALAAALVAGAAQAAPPADTILFVSARDHLVAYDAATGAEKARFGTPGLSSDMLVTPEGLLLLNHRDANQVVMVDARSLREVGRIASSGIGGTRPVHMYLAPARPDGRRLVLVANDGNPQRPARDDNSALIIDATDPAAPRVAGEVRLGIGHHKLAFARDGMRFSASNIADCDEVVGVYDIADPAKATRLFAVTGADLGLDGRDGRPACDPTGRQGRRAGPHGTATFGASGLHAHNANGTGQFILVEAEANPPLLAAVLNTRGGSGGASIAAHPAGRFAYGPQNTPRAGGAGAQAGGACQIGQLAVLDGTDRRLAAEVPILYDAGCAALPERAAGARPAYAFVTPDGRTLAVTVGTLNAAQPGRAGLLALFDLADPAAPRQVASVPVGASAGHRDAAMTADGRFLFVPGNADASVTIVDLAGRAAVRRLAVVAEPNRVAAWSPSAGPTKAPGTITLAAR